MIFFLPVFILKGELKYYPTKESSTETCSLCYKQTGNNDKNKLKHLTSERSKQWPILQRQAKTLDETTGVHSPCQGY